MKKFFLIISFVASAAIFAQDKQIFESPKMPEFVRSHKKVAILPFNATIGYRKLPKDYDAAANKKADVKLGNDMQLGM